MNHSLTLEQQEHIKSNRFKFSMLEMATQLDVSYNKVRNYMVSNDLMISKDAVNEIKRLKKQRNQKPNTPVYFDFSKIITNH